MPRAPMSPGLRQQINSVWISPDTFATTLLLLAVDTYGTEMLSWSPVTIRQEIEEDFGVKLPPANFDRLMAAILHITQPENFYKLLPDFNELCNVFSGDLASPDVISPSSAEDIAWGITEAVLLWPPDEEDEEPFSEEIIGFIAATLNQEGILVPPDILRLAGVDHELISKIRMDFSDDPTLFNGIWDMEKQKTEDINDVVSARLQNLVKQIKELQLENGDALKAAELLERGLRGKAEQNA